jgi:hypothetical protein
MASPNPSSSPPPSSIQALVADALREASELSARK